MAAAIDDVTDRPLVTCVLNAIDDALDRSDPGGTDWGPETIRHLQPLLARARRAGRTVLLTSDHGHIIERRAGRQEPHQGISSGRSRPADGPPPADGEVLVAGRRVLRHDHQAVLAVDERLRYGPMKAGYHGGAAPAEAVVPVCVLTPVLPPEVGLQVAGPQEPAWWYGPATPLHPPVPPPAQPQPAPATPAAPTLFDTADDLVAPATPAGEAAPPAEAAAPDVADAVLRSGAYRGQQRIAQRLAVADAQVRELLVALLAAPDHRLAAHKAAAALQVPTTALRGALAHVIRLLNVEGYAVLAMDPDGTTVVLDEPLLREQFGVQP